jgi:hypothetical protein
MTHAGLKEAGSVLVMAVSTARRVLTIVLSYVVFPGQGKTFSVGHLASALAVILGLVLGPAWASYTRHRAANQVIAQEEEETTRIVDKDVGSN